MKSPQLFLLVAVAMIFSLFVTNNEAQSAEPLRFYVGTYTSQDGSQGIYTGIFDAAKGAISEPELAVETVNPAFLAVHPTKPLLYGVGESQQGMVRAFLRDSATGKLTLHDEKPVPGRGPCHLALCLPKTGESGAAAVANYGSGSVVSFPLLENGKFGDVASEIQHEGKGPNPKRQTAPHAHGAYYSAADHTVAIPDLGIDQVLYYVVDPVSAKLSRSSDFASLISEPGAGPRHLAVSKDGQFVFVVNELDSTVSVFDRKSPKTPSRIQTVSTLPEGADAAALKNSTAEIELHPNGKFLYASNRGHDSIAVFAVADDGKLRLVQNCSSGGKTPRFFCLDPSARFLLTCNQDSGDICVLAVDQKTGELTLTSQKTDVPKPVCLVFANP